MLLLNLKYLWYSNGIMHNTYYIIMVHNSREYCISVLEGYSNQQFYLLLRDFPFGIDTGWNY